MSTESGTISRATKRILFMDDDATVRRVITLLLENLGHRVKSVSKGDEAIASYKAALSSPSPFDLVILDLTIKQGMGGIETVKHLREIDPDVTAIICSGFSSKDELVKYRDYGFSGVIIKPFYSEDLEDIIQKTPVKKRA